MVFRTKPAEQEVTPMNNARFKTLHIRSNKTIRSIKSTFLRKILLGVKPKSNLNMIHTPNMSHKQSKGSVCDACSFGEKKRASVPEGKMTAKLL